MVQETLCALLLPYLRDGDIQQDKGLGGGERPYCRRSRDRKVEAEAV